MSELTYNVPAMHCASCEATITEELEELPNVASVEVDLDTKQVVVRGETLDDAAIRAAIAEAGYQAL